MSTFCELTGVVREDQVQQGAEAFLAADNVLREIESSMGADVGDGGLRRFNRAPAGRQTLSAELLGQFRQSRAFHDQTHGAFDVTVRPLIELWKSAGKDKRLPTAAQVAAARAASSWDALELLDDGASKRLATVKVDLGGIAKKHAIDRVAAVLQRGGLAGGMVNIGGDMRCFGHRADGGPWRIAIQDPFHHGADPLGVLLVRDMAVCTSGNYERFSMIGGKRYSHIIDPVIGWPADAAAAVTVIGPGAISGVWATALSVLGPRGMEYLPAGTEAMVIVGDERNHKTHMTAGFARHLEQPIAGAVTTRPVR